MPPTSSPRYHEMILRGDTFLAGFTKTKIAKSTEFYKIPLNVVYVKPKPKCARIGKNKYVYDNKILNWVNHSCDPNAKLSINNQPGLIALRNINPNEKITVDYGKTENGNFKIKCSCGSTNCRKYFLIEKRMSLIS